MANAHRWIPYDRPGGYWASSLRRAAAGGTSGDASGRHDPFDRLVGHAGDQVEVVVVVQDDQSHSFGCGRDEQIGDLGATLLAAAIREHILHLDQRLPAIQAEAARLSEQLIAPAARSGIDRLKGR